MKRNLNAEDVRPIMGWISFFSQVALIILLLIALRYGLATILAEAYRNEVKQHLTK